MSKTRNASQATTRDAIYEPRITPIESDHTLESTIQPLNDLLSEFNNIMLHFDVFIGLTESQREELLKHLETRREFKALRAKGPLPLDITAYKKFIQNEREMLPLSRTMEWWEVNLRALKSHTTWNAIEDKVKEINRDKKAFLAFMQIRMDWLAQQQFAGYSSQQLLEFYENYLLVMQSHLKAFLEKRALAAVKKTEAILLDIEEQAILSMVMRLEASAAFNDYHNDDVLSLLVKKIHDTTGLAILDLSKKSGSRTGMNETTIHTMINHIKHFIAAHPERYDVKAKFESLEIMSIPELWEKQITLSFPEKLTAIQAIKHMRTLDKKHSVNTEVVHDYIRFCDTNILNKVTVMMRKKNAKLSLDELILLGRLLTHLMHDDAKMNLLAQINEEVTENPYWLTLINHLEDEETLNMLDEKIKSDDTLKPSQSFILTLLFSKRLLGTLKIVDGNIISQLMQKAGIMHDSQQSTIAESLSHKKVTSKKLLKLWDACQALLKTHPMETSTHHDTQLIIEVLDAIHKEIVRRSETKKNVLKEFLAKIPNSLWVPEGVRDETSPASVKNDRIFPD